MSRKALVIGAQGVLGALISQAFSQAGWEVARAGRRPERASDFRLLDLADPVALSEACAAAHVVVNTAHDPEFAPERTVLREGGTLIDLIELAPAERELLRGEAAESARGSVVLDTGLGGVAYLAIADLLAEHPEADEAEYSLMISASGSAGRAGLLMGHQALTAAAHHRSVKLPFAQPFGSLRCLEIGANGEGLFRTAIGGRPICHYLCMRPRALQSLLLALNGAHLMSMLPSATFTAGASKASAKPSDERICEWVAVGRGGQRLGARTIEGCGYYRMTAAATLAFAEALPTLSSTDSAQRGLLSIDELLTLDAVRPAIEQHEIFVREQPVEGDGRAG